MRHRVITLCVALASVVIFRVAVTDADETNGKTDVSKEIHALLIERRDTLRKRAELVDVQFRSGLFAVDFAIACQNDLLEAELDVADAPDKRVKLREEMLSNLKTVEKFAELNYANGTGTVHEQLAAKAARIAADIALRREQQVK